MVKMKTKDASGLIPLAAVSVRDAYGFGKE